jgi:hypothetical protein
MTPNADAPHPIPHHQLESNPIQFNKRARTPNEDDGKGWQRQTREKRKVQELG